MSYTRDVARKFTSAATPFDTTTYDFVGNRKTRTTPTRNDVHT